MPERMCQEIEQGLPSPRSVGRTPSSLVFLVEILKSRRNGNPNAGFAVNQGSRIIPRNASVHEETGDRSDKMPITPFHFGPGIAVHAMAPKRISFLAFCLSNIFIDVEPLYFIVVRQPPLHRFFHTYLGASLIVMLTIGVFVVAQKLTSHFSVPNLFQWRNIKLTSVAMGAILGSYSHILLDSFMHSDITPLAPFSESNLLLGLITLADLHSGCIVSGVVGVVILLIRRSHGQSSC